MSNLELTPHNLESHPAEPQNRFTGAIEGLAPGDAIAFVNETVSSAVLNGISWGAAFEADLAVFGPGTAGGTLNVVGTWQAPDHRVGDFTVTGTLGGQQVAMLVPQA